MVRNTTIKRASSGTFTTRSGYCNLQTFNLSLPTDVVNRTVTLRLPISELTTDGRFLTVIATAGGVTRSTTINGPAAGGCCLNIVEVVLPNVPGSANTVSISINTSSGANPGAGHPEGCGQSWVLAGIVYADIECPNVTAGNDHNDAPASYGNICYTIFNDPAFGTTRFGAGVTADSGPLPSAAANADTDDGITFSAGGNWLPGQTQTITISWNTNDGGGHVFGWIDWNSNGVFDDPSERVIDNFKVGNPGETDNFGGNRARSGTKTFTISVPQNATCGNTFARFTIQSDINEIGPTGNFCASDDPTQDGEVEDYRITISNLDPGTIVGDETRCGVYDPNVVIGNNLGAGALYRWEVKVGSGSWTIVGGQTAKDFDPGFISENVQIRRSARASVNCPWLVSNIVTKTVNPNPVASITGNQTICAGGSSVFTATGGGTYAWSTGATTA
ncbi:MAG: hypothetical protein HC821_02825, partial [Lewinella sp.]|nr:hypothetical protein [Lewinella sp.]